MHYFFQMVEGVFLWVLYDVYFNTNLHWRAKILRMVSSEYSGNHLFPCSLQNGNDIHWVAQNAQRKDFERFYEVSNGIFNDMDLITLFDIFTGLPQKVKICWCALLTTII